MSIYKHKPTKSFAGIPRHIVNSDAFKTLKGNEVKLLLMIAHFYDGKNNGDIAITMSILKDWFKSNTTLLRAKNGLLEKGFIVINAYGGRSAEGKKLPHLFALTWLPINDLKPGKWEMRFTHYTSNRPPLNYWKDGSNPDYKSEKQRDAQYKRDIRKIRKTSTSS
jgi:hypothetical protein